MWNEKKMLLRKKLAQRQGKSRGISAVTQSNPARLFTYS